MNAVGHWLGLDDPSGPLYLFWSGFAGQLDRVALVVVVWRRFNCHKDNCWRIGLHRVADGDRMHHLCHRHSDSRSDVNNLSHFQDG